MRPSLLCLLCLAAPVLAAEVCPPPEREEQALREAALKQQEVLRAQEEARCAADREARARADAEEQAAERQAQARLESAALLVREEEARQAQQQIGMAVPRPPRSQGAVHLGGAFGLFSSDVHMTLLAGATAGLRHTFWFDSPSVSGLELGAQALYYGVLLDASGGLRLWFGPVGLGAETHFYFLWARGGGPALGVGPTLAFALVDDRTTRVLLGGRLVLPGAWTAARLEVEYSVLHFTLEAGITPGSIPYGVATLGLRLGW